MLATLSRFEPMLISERTKAPLAQKRRTGVRLGAPPEIDPTVERGSDRSGQRGSLHEITERL
jgi:DNA invertase Pin-like site-specific DNA recombinase